MHLLPLIKASLEPSTDCMTNYAFALDWLRTQIVTRGLPLYTFLKVRLRFHGRLSVLNAPGIVATSKSDSPSLKTTSSSFQSSVKTVCSTLILVPSGGGGACDVWSRLWEFAHCRTATFPVQG